MEYKRKELIDMDTGEIEATIVVGNNEEVILKTKKILNPQQITYLKNQSTMNEYGNLQGGFVQMLFKQKELLDLGHCDKATFSRFVYLSTYIDYNDRNGNLLIKRGQFNDIEPLSKRDMQYILKLSEASFRNFIRDVKTNGLLYEEDNKFYITERIMTKGQLLNDSNYNCACRMYIKLIRNLYESATPRQHKVLGNIFLLIPFIHKKTNILTFNPDETNIVDIEPITLNNMCELLNINDKSHYRKLVHDLEKFKVKIEGVDYKMFAWVRLTDRDYFILNPRVIYRGNDYNTMCEIADTYFFVG